MKIVVKPKQRYEAGRLDHCRWEVYVGEETVAMFLGQDAERDAKAWVKQMNGSASIKMKFDDLAVGTVFGTLAAPYLKVDHDHAFPLHERKDANMVLIVYGTLVEPIGRVSEIVLEAL